MPGWEWFCAAVLGIRHWLSYLCRFRIKPIIMPDSYACPACRSTVTYDSGLLWACAECGHEWDPQQSAEAATEDQLVVKDANGNVLQDGDSVIVLKDLPVKGMPKPVKAGTKVKNIRLAEGDHNIDCKIEGFGAMGLKSEFVRKA